MDLSCIHKRAIRKGLEFDLDTEWYKKELGKGICTATKLSFKLKPTNVMLNPYYPAIDRIDSSKGYTKDNCQLVLSIFNMLKLNYDEVTVKRFCESFVQIYEENLI